MGRLTLTLLGSPEIRYAGQALKFPTRKTLALLVYLCVERGFHSREKLSALLWPDRDGAKGRGSLRLTLTYLRSALRDALQDTAATVSSELPLLSQQDRLGFDFASAWEMDLAQLQAAAQIVRETRGALTATQRAWLQSALDSYRGDFLEAFFLDDAPDFDNWASLQREAWHRRASLVFDRLSQAQFEGGELADAVETTTRWVAHDPLNESAHRRLMQVHLAQGDRTAALQAFTACRVLLAEELNAEPSPETMALADRIQGFAKPEIDVVPGDMHSSAQIDLQSLRAPLVGRAEEHLALVTLYRTARRGQCQVVVIEGEPGIGKTRLTGEFLRWASAQGADVWHGRAFETGGRLPYQPLIEMLRRRLEQENAPDDLLADLWLAELSQLLPELRDRYPDLPLPMAGNADFMCGRLYEAVACLSKAIAIHKPLVLFIDDVQWTDAGTRDIFHYLTRRWSEARTPVLLVLTARPESMLPAPVLRDWFAGMARDVTLTRLTLAPLRAADLRELLRTLASAMEHEEQAGRQFSEWLMRETGGSPFFVAEMLRMLQEQGLLVGELQPDGRFAMDAITTWQHIQARKELPLPPTVRSVILARLARLSPKASALLLSGAVIGRRSSFELLCRVAHMDEFETLPALEELLDSGLLLETGDGAQTLTFAHDNFREVIYSEAGITRRRLYHRQALAALEEMGAPPAELVFHAAAARLLQPALQYALAAGDAAMSLHAFADAVAHYATALELAGQVDISLAQRCHLCIQQGRALELTGQYTAALAHYETMVRHAEKTGERALTLAALVAMGTIRTTANALSDFVLAERLSRQALALARELGDSVAEAKAQWNLLNVYRMTHRNEQAQAIGEQALALAQELDIREQMAFVANDLVYVYTVAGDVSRTLSTIQMATELWRELGNQPMLTDSLTSYANTLAMTGAYATALEVAHEARQLAYKLENLWAQSNSLIPHGVVYWRQMAVDRALAAMDESVRLGQMAGFVGTQVVMRTGQARLRLALGDVAQARVLAEAAMKIASKSVALVYSSAAGALALVALHEGELAEAADILATVPEGSALDIFNQLTLETALCQQFLAHALYDDAYTLSSRVLSFLQPQGLYMFIPDFLYFQGQALVGLGRYAQARESLEAAAAMLQAIEGRWLLWEISALLAELAGMCGDATAVCEWQTIAHTAVQAIAESLSDSVLRETFLAEARKNPFLSMTF